MEKLFSFSLFYCLEARVSNAVDVILAVKIMLLF